MNTQQILNHMRTELKDIDFVSLMIAYSQAYREHLLGTGHEENDLFRQACLEKDEDSLSSCHFHKDADGNLHPCFDTEGMGKGITETTYEGIVSGNNYPFLLKCPTPIDIIKFNMTPSHLLSLGNGDIYLTRNFIQ